MTLSPCGRSFSRWPGSVQFARTVVDHPVATQQNHVARGRVSHLDQIHPGELLNEDDKFTRLHTYYAMRKSGWYVYATKRRSFLPSFQYSSH
jgi:hypothetical protein